MLITARSHIARIMFIVMLATFASPTLGWGMVATHDQLSHGLAGTHVGEHHVDHHHDEHDVNPHSSIGHMFTHMPVGLTSITSLTVQPQAQPEPTFLRQSIRAVALEPPLRPPKVPLSC